MAEKQFEKITKEVMKEYPQFNYNIAKSQKSHSLYLYIKDDMGLMKILRVSDHKNNLNFYDREIIFHKVKGSVLKRTIINLCKSLERKRVYFLLKKLKVAQFENC